MENVKTSNRGLGLSPAIAEKILQMDIIPEAKLVLMTMCHWELISVSFQTLDNLLNCPLNEKDVARLALCADRISVNKISNMITLNNEWKDLVKENKDVQLFSGFTPNSGSDKSNPK